MRRAGTTQIENQRLLPTKERFCHRGNALSGPTGASPKCRGGHPKKAQYECSLDAYLDKNIITHAEFEAGLKFYREYARSVLKIKVYESTNGSFCDAEMSRLSAINGNAVLKRAFDILTLNQRSVIFAVCVEGYFAGSTRRVHFLRQGLALLAKTWGLLG